MERKRGDSEAEPQAGDWMDEMKWEVAGEAGLQ